MILESLIMANFFIDRLLACISPCQMARISAMLLELCPRLQAKLRIIFPDLSRMAPPLPAGPGFPFEAPSTCRICLFSADLHFINSCSSSLISHGEKCLTVFLVLVSRSGSSPWNQLYSFLSGLASLVILGFEATSSPNSAFTLVATWAGGTALSLKILLFLSSHSFQH